MEWEGVQEPPPLTEKLETRDGFWGRESQFFCNEVTPGRSTTLQEMAL